MKTMPLRFLSALSLILLFLARQSAQPAYAAAYVVNSLADNTTAGNGFCTLREAIASANKVGNGDCGADSGANDTIAFSVSGTIALGSTLPNIASGAGTLTIDGGGNIIISGNNSVRAMQVDSGANLTLQNLTIANGFTNGGGGGIFNNLNGTLNVINSTFSGNNAFSGGGIYNNGGTLTITGSLFSANSANYGGGIFNLGTLTVTGSTFSVNGASIFGGGIYNNPSGMLNVINSTFSANSANSDGGGIFNNGTLMVTNSTFSANSAINSGGGIYVASGTATLKNTLIANSTSGGDCVGTLSGTNNNNLTESTGANACGLTNGVGSNIIGQDPQLGVLTGSPAYFPLNTGSPAIDAGDNITCSISSVDNRSQNGVLRPQDGDGNGTAVCDIGSYERIAELRRLYLPLIRR